MLECRQRIQAPNLRARNTSTVPCSKQQVVTVISSLLKHTVQTRPEKDLGFKDNSKLQIFGWLCHGWKENTNIVEFPATWLHPEGCSPAHLPLMDGASGQCFSYCPAQPCLDPFPPTPWPGCREAAHHHYSCLSGSCQHLLPQQRQKGDPKESAFPYGKQFCWENPNRV